MIVAWAAGCREVEVYFPISKTWEFTPSPEWREDRQYRFKEPEPMPWRESASDYERRVIDGMQKQAQSSVDKAVNAMTQRKWVGLTDEDKKKIATAAGCTDDDDGHIVTEIFRLAEAKLKERNA
jgi:hypothetical protein